MFSSKDWLMSFLFKFFNCIPYHSWVLGYVSIYVLTYHLINLEILFVMDIFRYHMRSYNSFSSSNKCGTKSMLPSPWLCCQIYVYDPCITFTFGCKIFGFVTQCISVSLLHDVSPRQSIELTSFIDFIRFLKDVKQWAGKFFHQDQWNGHQCHLPRLD